MATRKIIDAKHNGEKVWLKGHAQATYMSNGSTVEDAINSLQGGSGEAGPETDPVFLASPAATITEDKKTEWDSKYSKPSGGIPKSDLASDVQTSLGNAVQKDMVGTLNIIEVDGVYDGDYVYALPTAAAKNADENYDDIILSRGSVKTINGKSIVGSGNIEISGGTITGVSANGTSVATSGVANIPAASTSAYGVTKLSSATNSSSTTLAATASAVKSAYDLANSYKGTVTSVRINGTTKNSSSGVVDLGYINKQASTFSGSTINLRPNQYTRISSTTLSTLTITLSSINNTTILNEYFVEFTTSSSGTTVSLPSGIKWMNGVTPTFEASTTYQISIVNNLGTWVKFK